MKIDPRSLPNDATRVNAAKDSNAEGSPRATGSPVRGDAVSVSSDAQLAAEAARRIGDVSGDVEIRADVVERAKAAVARGEVGTDLERLADRLIDGHLDDEK